MLRVSSIYLGYGRWPTPTEVLEVRWDHEPRQGKRIEVATEVVEHFVGELEATRW